MVDPTKLKNRIAHIIAATRFPFVDQENWSDGNTTTVNDETLRYGIKWEKGVLYPNIVVTNHDGSIREFGLVEGAEDVSEASLERWRALSDAAPYGREHKKLFLYVPEGLEERAMGLLEGNGIDYDGIRGYRVENQSLRILPFKTRNDEYDHAVT